MKQNTFTQQDLSDKNRALSFPQDIKRGIKRKYIENMTGMRWNINVSGGYVYELAPPVKETGKILKNDVNNISTGRDVGEK